MQIESKIFHTGPHSTTNTIIQNMAQPVTSFRTTTPSTAMTGRMTIKQVNPVHVHPNTSCKAPLEHCMHVHQPTVQVFPCDKKNLPTDLHEFWPHRKMLSVKFGLITCGNRIIVPREMLQYIYEGHQGKERCLLQARNTVFWPKMTYDVQELIERCIIC